MEKLQLHGFNNLTKSLSFNIYDICYAKSGQQQRRYIEYIDEMYNAKRDADIDRNECDHRCRNFEHRASDYGLRVPA